MIITTGDSQTIHRIVDGCLAQLDFTHVTKGIFPSEGLYLNRLTVPEKIRRRGIATELMSELTRVCENFGVPIYLEINAYGGLNTEQLSAFYKKFGFEDSEVEGLFVRKPNRDGDNQFRKVACDTEC